MAYEVKNGYGYGFFFQFPRGLTCREGLNLDVTTFPPFNSLED